MPIDTIADRTSADVARIRHLNSLGWAGMTTAERAEWLTASRGRYNASDLNRVEGNTRTLADMLAAYGYRVDVETKTDWTMADLADPHTAAAEMSRYLGDIRKLAAAFHTLPTTPEPPGSMDALTHTGANDIEAVQRDIYFLINAMAAEFIYAGEIYAGEDDFI